MARDSKKKKGKDAHHAAAHAPRLDGQAPKLDTRLAKVVAKRVKKLRVQLAEATRREHKKVRALDKAHRRRQLIEAAIDELSMDVAAKPSKASTSAAAVTAPAPAPAPAPAQPPSMPARPRARKPASPKA